MESDVDSKEGEGSCFFCCFTDSSRDTYIGKAACPLHLRIIDKCLHDDRQEEGSGE